MRFAKQPNAIRVTANRTVEDLAWDESRSRRHGSLLPNSARAVRRTERDPRLLLHGQARERGLLLAVPIVRVNTETLDQRQREFSHAVQTGRNELASRVQRSREHRHDVRGV